MKKTKAVIAAALMTTMLASTALTGCGKEAAALTINGEDISVGTANFMLRWGQAESYSTWINMGFASVGSAFWDTQMSEDNEQTYGENFKDSIKTTLTEDVILRQQAKEYGVSLSQEQEDAIKETAQKAMAANGDVFKAMKVTEENIAEVLELYTYAEMMRAPLIEGKVDYEVSEEEAAQSTITYARVYLRENTDEGLVFKSDEAIAALCDEAQKALDEINASEDPATVNIEEITEAINEEWFCTTYSYGKDDEYLDAEIKEIAAGLEDGEVYQDIIKPAEANYIYIIRMEKKLDPEKTAAKIENIKKTREADKYTEVKAELVANATVVEKKAWTDLKVDDKKIFTATMQSTGE